MYYYVAFWTSVAVVKMPYNTAFTKCMKTFCNGSCIYQVTFANGTQDVWGQLREMNQALQMQWK